MSSDGNKPKDTSEFETMREQPSPFAQAPAQPAQTQAQAQQAQQASKPAQQASQATSAASAPEAPAQAKKPKLSYKEQRELDGMEATILAAEEAKASLEAELADSTLYTRDPKRAGAAHAELEKATKEVERLYARWQDLQDRAS